MSKQNHKTVRAVHSDGITFHIEMIPQTVGAMGAEIKGAYRARITLEGSANGGLGPRAAIARLATQAKKFAASSLEPEDLRELDDPNPATAAP